MSVSKLRGKSALFVQHDSNNNSSNSKLVKPYVPPTTASLLKIEPFVPTFSTRFRKPIYRSYSTLSSSCFKRINDQRYHHRSSRFPERGLQQPQRSKSSLSTGSKISQNGVCRIARAAGDQEKLPDRINYDRRGLTAIPIFENEQNLRLLSLQHNLINVFHIPDDSVLQHAATDKPKCQDNEKIFPTDPQLDCGSRLHRDTGATIPSNTGTSILGVANITASAANAIHISANTLTPASPNTLSPHAGRQRTPLLKKSSFLHNHQKHVSLRKSNSFVNQFPQHFNTSQKHGFQRSSPLIRNGVAASLVSLSSFGSELSRQSGIEQDEENTTENRDIQLLKVKNNQLIPSYGTVFQNLVFLDLYDNQIEKISSLDGLKSLSVLLLGKNRISEITGLASLKNTLRVLDLHGNKISNISNKINCLQKLKSLNLAGNQIRQINENDFVGMGSLKELNLKRNRIKRVYGFHHLVSLERLWLCHNDIHRVEEMYSIGDAANLQEVTIENNPVSLAGDCVSFLVSYLPNLVLLSQMPITDQVRMAAMAWRKGKELSYANQINANAATNGNIRREEVISNARTNWELLRSQQTITPKKNPSPKSNSISASYPAPVMELDQGGIQEIQSAYESEQKRTNNRSKTASVGGSRQKCRDNCTSEFFRLPPISQTNVMNSKTPSEKTNSSGSSLGPNVDSSSSCYTSDDNEELRPLSPDYTPDSNTLDASQVEEQLVAQGDASHAPPLTKDNANACDESTDPKELLLETTEADSQPQETSSPHQLQDTVVIQNPVGISCDTSIINNQPEKASTLSMSVISVKSDSDVSSQHLNQSEKGPKNRNSSIASRRSMHGTLARSQTARTRATLINNHSINNSNGPNCSGTSAAVSTSSKPVKVVVEREREQGGDYLIEICGRYLNIYGLGALRFIDKQWNAQKANDVHTLNFSYVNFNSIAGVLGRIKLRFPNAESFAFRETNINALGQLNALAELQGITTLAIDAEGNPICSKTWRPYAIYRLSHWGLKTINNKEITESEIEAAHSEYMGLSDLVLWSLPESLLQPLLARLRLEETCSASKLTAKAWLMQADHSLKVVVGKEALQWKKPAALAANNLASSHQCPDQESSLRERGIQQLSVMIENTCNAVEKLQILEKIWPSMLLDIIRNTLLDYSQSDVYIKNLMADIMK